MIVPYPKAFPSASTKPIYSAVSPSMITVVVPMQNIINSDQSDQTYLISKDLSSPVAREMVSSNHGHT